VKESAALETTDADSSRFASRWLIKRCVTFRPGNIDEWIRKVMPDLNPIVKHLDKAIRKGIPDLEYAVKWKKAYYGLPKLGWVIEMVAYDVSVNVVFLGEADFDDPPPLGSGRSRYVKVHSLEEAKVAEIGQWIEEAGRVKGWK
jgi:hypothetical protein